MGYLFNDRKFRKSRQNPEYHLQKWLALQLDSMGVLWCASAGGMRTGIATAMKMKAMGYKKGFPDIFLAEVRGNFHGMLIEVKLGSYPTPEQKHWQQELTKRGYYAIIVPATFEAKEAQEWLLNEINSYLGIIKTGGG